MLEQTERQLLDLTQQLDALRHMANETAGGAIPQDFLDVTATIADQVGHLKNEITDVVPKLSNLTERFRKKTINIGVAGNARQGKSTVLQHISGLTDQEIPTSDKLPCTGAKSKIHHFEGKAYADIEFYSADEFFRDIILPYFQDFQRLNYPLITSLHDFEKPLPQLDFAQSAELVSDEAKYKKLVEIHQAFPEFKHLLSTEKTVPLSEISKYVTQQDKLYLAVKTAYIYTKFPNHDVTGLCFVDLPGMEAAQYHELKLALSLKQEVDAVIFLKRPDPSGDQWQKADYAVLNMIAAAAPEIELSNWLFTVLNEMEAPSNQHLIPLLKDDAPNTARQANMLVSNCKRPDGSEMVFEAVLNHLEQNLEKIDRVLLDSLEHSVEQIVSKVTLQLGPALKFFSAAQGDSGQHEKFWELFDRFLIDSKTNLEKLVKEVHERSYLDGIQQTFLAKVKEVCDDAEQTLPLPANQVLEDEYYKCGGWFGVVEEYLHYLRAHLTKHLAQHLDLYLDELMEKVFREVLVQSLSKPEGLLGMVSQQDETLKERQILEAFYHLLNPKQHEQLCQTFEYMFKFNFSYQSHFHYRVRQQMKTLDPLDNPESVTGIVPPNANAQHAPDIARGLETMYRQALGRIRKQFINELQADPSNAIFALVEEIRDRLARSEDIDKEWRIFLYLRRAQVWPEEFSQFEQETALRRKWQNLLDAILTQSQKLQSTRRK
jgi:hypothetical protein